MSDGDPRVATTDVTNAEYRILLAMWQGSVVSIHIAPAASESMVTVTEVRALPERGLEGDRYALGTGHYSGRSSVGGREVTLIEHARV